MGKGRIKKVEMDFYLQLKKASRDSETSTEYQTEKPDLSYQI